jgi:hypothetical protein
MAMVPMFILKTYGGLVEPDKLNLFLVLLKNINSMKNIKILGLIVTLMIMILSCEDSVDPAGERGIGVVPVITDANPSFFLAADMVNSYVEFVVNLTDGATASGGVIQASLNGEGERKQVATILSFPATVRVTGTDITTALGISASDIHGGDVINLEVITTKDGRTTRSNAVLNASVACEYDPDLASGSYHAYSEPSQWNAEGDITLETDPIDSTIIYVTGLAEMEGNVEDGDPLVMHIDLSTFKVIADKTVIATDYFGYTNGAWEGTGSYNSCDGSFEMDFTISSDEANFGTYPFTFTKN